MDAVAATAHETGMIAAACAAGVHDGQAELVHATRQKTLDHAFRANPIRFLNKAPEPPQMPTTVWINPPAQKVKVEA